MTTHDIGVDGYTADETDPVHRDPFNPASRWGGWGWREPRYAEHFRTCSFCGSIHPDDLVAEQAGNGECRTCGAKGWDECFGGQQPSWYAALKREGRLAEAGLPPEQLAVIDRRPAEHVYDCSGWYASWADRKYGWPHKFYVKGLAQRPEEAVLPRYIGSSHGGDGSHPDWGGADATWVRAAELTDEQREILDKDGARPDPDSDAWYCLGPKPSVFAKFYSIHLADPKISDETKAKISAVSGLWFHFYPDGRIQWAPDQETLQEGIRRVAEQESQPEPPEAEGG